MLFIFCYICCSMACIFHFLMMIICYILQKPLHDTVGFRKETDGVTVDVALQWYSIPLYCPQSSSFNFVLVTYDMHAVDTWSSFVMLLSSNFCVLQFIFFVDVFIMSLFCAILNFIHHETLYQPM